MRTPPLSWSAALFRRRNLFRAAAFLLAVAIAMAVGFLIGFPLARAYVCPGCSGFEPIEDAIYVEATMPQAKRDAAQETIKSARAVVREFYGDLLRAPRVFICNDAACYRRYSGSGSRGMATLDWLLILAPDGITPVIAAHEMAHIELHARAGAWRVWRGGVPRWFDEGLAVNVSNDPRYLAPGVGTSRCVARTDDPLPVSRHDWLAQANDGLYAVAACRVSEWLAAKGGPDAVRRLADRVRAGEPFESAFR